MLSHRPIDAPAVDPDNRLVADTLEADWNHALRALQAAQDDYQRATAQATLDDANKARIRQLAADLPLLWSDPATPDRERKRIARLLIEDVTLNRAEQINLHVRFRGGPTTTLTISIPLASWQQRQTSPDTLRALDPAARRSHRRPGRRAAQSATPPHRHQPAIHRPQRDRPAPKQQPPQPPQPTPRPRTTHQERDPKHLGVHPTTIKHWHAAGLLTSHKANDNKERLYDPPPPATGGSCASKAGPPTSENTHDRTKEVHYETHA